MKSHVEPTVKHDILATHGNQNTTAANILTGTYRSGRCQCEPPNSQTYPMVEYVYQTSARE